MLLRSRTSVQDPGALWMIGVSGLFAAALVGMVTGAATYGVLLLALDDSLALGAVVYGAAGAVVGFIGAYVITVIVLTCRWRPAGSRLTAIVLLAVLPLAALGAAVALRESESNSEKESARRQLLDAHGALVLVDGKTLERPFPGWALRSVSVNSAPAGVRVEWKLVESTGVVASLQMAEVGAVERCTYCQEVGQRADGTAILASQSIYVTTLGPAEYTLRVFGDHDGQQAVELLRRLEPVSANEFKRECGSRC